MGEVPELLVPLLKTEWYPLLLVNIVVQFSALKCTVVNTGQFQNEKSPTEVTPVPIVSSVIPVQP